MNGLRILRSPSVPLRPRRTAYRVPWRVDRSSAPHYRLVNTGRHELRGVTVSLAGPASLRVHSPASVRPGEAVRATVTGGDLARSALLVVRWFAPDGREYLWQLSF
ncbi:hypothetical protein [Leifsonia sp. AG29]|uniref:hypothetical protein n=1 Tax=Leifsonia sp. AG29 TaxID=2598860 RepID=UPI00131C89CA|nr:hypothetical protein [Leifsonia sp. AG29]